MVMPDGKEFVATGRVEGAIVDDPRGTNGFGYDPHFEIDDPDATEFTGLTMAEISLDEKNRISHRARAYRNLLKQLERSRLFNGTEAFARIGGENGADVVGRR
jgi:XTP/dITP diphosphohydrolase